MAVWTKKKYQKKITYVGDLSGTELSELYSGSDLYISLSTYHDEDFGLAPLEALTHGCPALLSKWGGYKDFDLDLNSVRHVPIRLGTNDLKIDRRKFKRFFEFFLQKPDSFYEKAERMQFFRNHYSIRTTAKALTALHKKKFSIFKGPNRVLSEYARKILALRHHGKPVFGAYTNKDKDYSKIYNSYYSAE